MNRMDSHPSGRCKWPSVSRGLNVASATLIAGLIALGVWDVGTRQFGLPYMPGGSDLPALLLAAIAFLAWPDIEASDAHVRTTLVISRLRARYASALTVAGQLVACGVVGWLLVASTERARDSLGVGESTVGADSLPVWPVRALLAVILLILLAEMVRTLVRRIRDTSGARSSTGSKGDVL